MKNIGTKKLEILGLSALQGRYSVHRAARISEFYRRGPFLWKGPFSLTVVIVYGGIMDGI